MFFDFKLDMIVALMDSDNGFITKLHKLWDQKKFVCVGLDSDYSKIPQFLKEEKSISDAIFEFNRAIIDKTADLVCAYKIQIAYFEKEGIEGLKALELTVKYLKENYPEIPIILDAKRGDIASTNAAYAKAYFDNLGVDALTLHPYLGKESLQPFLEYKNKGVIILVKTSNKGAGEIQDLEINGEPLYKLIARKVKNEWNENGNCLLVVGATYPEELKEIREIAGEIPILIPGVGEQGGDLEKVVLGGIDKNKKGVIINSSRGVIFASESEDFAEVAREKVKELNKKISSFL